MLTRPYAQTPYPRPFHHTNCLHLSVAAALFIVDKPTIKATNFQGLLKVLGKRQYVHDFISKINEVSRDLALPREGFNLDDHAERLANLYPHMIWVFSRPEAPRYLLNNEFRHLVFKPRAGIGPNYTPHPWRLFHSTERRVVLLEFNRDMSHVEMKFFPGSNNHSQYCYVCNKKHTIHNRKCQLLNAWANEDNMHVACGTIHHEDDEPFAEPQECKFKEKGCNFLLTSPGCRHYHEMMCNYRYTNNFMQRLREQRQKCNTCQRIHGASDECSLRCSIQYPEIRAYDEIWAWDTEAELEEHVEKVGKAMITVHRHNVNCIVAVKVYPKPQENQERETRHFSKMEEFFDFFNNKPVLRNGQIYLWAHNLRGYDGRHLMKFLVSTGRSPASGSVIKGSRFFKIVVGKKLNFFDFNCHYSQSLDSSIKAYGIQGPSGYENKLFFPYRFNCTRHRGYNGTLPDIKWYDVNLMSASKKARFEIWYREHCNDEFNLSQALIDYCTSDTMILANAMCAHNETMTKITGFTPMYSVTVASFARNVWQIAYFNPAATENETKLLKPLSHDLWKFEKNAVRGGRTDVRVLNFELNESQKQRGWRIRYLDVKSMYPHVMRNFKLPAGQVEVKLFDEYNQPEIDYVMNFIGIVEVDIDPPQEYIHHPWLVVSENGKLIAPLRRLTNYVCTSIELQAALRHGYRLLKVHKIHAYQEEELLFKTYVDAFMEIKEKAQREGNASMKQLAKILLNSLYGKFLQRPDQPNTVYYSNISQELCENWKEEMKNQEVRGEIRLLTDFICLRHEPPYLYQVRTVNTNLDSELESVQVAVGSFIAAGGRLILTEQLHKLGERVLYHDTDSIVYVDMNDGVSIQEGTQLGEWEDECKPGEEITHFVSLAPKTYAYRVEKPDGTMKEVVKAKGITLHAAASEKITYQSLKNMLNLTAEEIIRVRQFTIDYNQKNQNVRSRTMEKELVFNPTLLKGMLKGNAPNFFTVPFGSEQFINAPERLSIFE